MIYIVEQNDTPKRMILKKDDEPLLSKEILDKSINFVRIGFFDVVVCQDDGKKLYSFFMEKKHDN